MRRLLLLVSLAALLASCGPPATNCCGVRTNLGRGAVYVATLPSPDGGAPTEVRVTVTDSGATTLTFLNGGHEIVEGFDTVALNR